ncbi:rhamnosyltransferase, partial [Pasteurellaceae bacterium 20609_3]|nr:rhamnosyltransferase [Spirabiliibacterium mucosae]
VFNYPESSLLKSVNNIDQLGIKLFYIQFFSAYRLSTFRAVGGFPQNVILAEDMYICAKMIYAGFEVLYNANACVNHSHNYSIKQEFQRYFDTGVFHEQQPWITQKIPRVSNEGFKFVLSELVFLWKNHPVWIPFSIIYTFVKWLGFNLGKNWYRLPSICLMWFSMHKNFWK